MLASITASILNQTRHSLEIPNEPISSQPTLIVALRPIRVVHRVAFDLHFFTRLAQPEQKFPAEDTGATIHAQRVNIRQMHNYAGFRTRRATDQHCRRTEFQRYRTNSVHDHGRGNLPAHAIGAGPYPLAP